MAIRATELFECVQAMGPEQRAELATLLMGEQEAGLTLGQALKVALAAAVGQIDAGTATSPIGSLTISDGARTMTYAAQGDPFGPEGATLTIPTSEGPKPARPVPDPPLATMADQSRVYDRLVREREQWAADGGCPK
jgi:hypothetical protein